MKPFGKLKKRAQRTGGAYGNKHVDKYLKRRANGFVRRFFQKEIRDAGTI